MDPKGASPSPNPPANIYLMFLEAPETGLEKKQLRPLGTTNIENDTVSATNKSCLSAFRCTALSTPPPGLSRAHVSGTILHGTNRQ